MELPARISAARVRSTGLVCEPCRNCLTTATMYRAFERRDPSYEGVFWLGVRTTGIFCRPTCRARTPKRENVEFFAAPCRCAARGLSAVHEVPAARPRPQAAAARGASCSSRSRPNRAAATATPSSPAMGIDPSTARRQFKRYCGMTFQAYHRARRMGLALLDIRKGKTVIDSQLDQGFESGSGFREAFTRLVGAAPSRAADVGVLHAKWLETPLGPMLALADDRGLHLLDFVDRRGLERALAMLQKRLRARALPGEHRYLAQIERELARVLRRHAARVRHAGRAHRLGVPEPRVGGAARRSRPGVTCSYAAARGAHRPAAGGARGRPRQRRQPPVDHRALPSRDRRRRRADGLRRRARAQAEAPRSRAHGHGPNCSSACRRGPWRCSSSSQRCGAARSCSCASRCPRWARCRSPTSRVSLAAIALARARLRAAAHTAVSHALARVRGGRRRQHRAAVRAVLPTPRNTSPRIDRRRFSTRRARSSARSRPRCGSANALTIGKVAGMTLGITGVAILVGWHPETVSARIRCSPSAPASSAAMLLRARERLHQAQARRTSRASRSRARARCAAALALMPALPFTSVPGPLTPLVIANVVALALGSTAVAYLIYFKLIADAGPQRALTVTFLHSAVRRAVGLPVSRRGADGEHARSAAC